MNQIREEQTNKYFKMGTVRLGLDPSKSTPCKSIFFMISSQNLFNHCSNSSFSFSGVVSFQRGASFRIVTSSYNCWASLHCFSIVSFQYAFTRCYIKLHLLGFLHSNVSSFPSLAQSFLHLLM